MADKNISLNFHYKNNLEKFHFKEPNNKNSSKILSEIIIKDLIENSKKEKVLDICVKR